DLLECGDSPPLWIFLLLALATSQQEKRRKIQSGAQAPHSKIPFVGASAPRRPTMITGPLKAKVDRLWEEFWTGGITNPLTVIEQISFLAFARLLDIRESTDEKKWRRMHPGRPFKGVFRPDEQE